MAIKDDALLALPKNPAIDWLLGSVLRNLAIREQSHFLFELLAGKNPHALEQWNAWIAEFRSVLRNPAIAAQKAEEELSTSGPERISDFMSEVFAVLNLSRAAYTDFEAVLARGNRAAVDFMALNEGQRVRIEVKHLHEPQDIIRTAVTQRWKSCNAKNPSRFNFWLGVRHHHHGVLSEVAIARLNNAIDSLPDIAANEYHVTLDGGIDVVLTRTTTVASNSGLAISTGFGSEDFEFDLPELQNLYIKAFRVVSDSLSKFFGRQADADAINVIAMQWDTPNFMHDEGTPQTVQRAIEQAFATVGFQLKVLIFAHEPHHDSRFCAQ